jgi:hypothetical protein
MSYDLILRVGKELREDRLDIDLSAIRSFAALLGGELLTGATTPRKQGERFGTLIFAEDPRTINDQAMVGSFIRFARDCGLLVEDPQLGEILDADQQD